LKVLLAAAALLLFASPASAADLSQFNALCPTGGNFLLGQGPAGSDNARVLVALCPCLAAEFKDYSQPEIDALAADLRAGSSDAGKAAYPQYAELKSKASSSLLVCMNDGAVVEAMRANGQN